MNKCECVVTKVIGVQKDITIPNLIDRSNDFEFNIYNVEYSDITSGVKSRRYINIDSKDDYGQVKKGYKFFE